MLLFISIKPTHTTFLEIDNFALDVCDTNLWLFTVWLGLCVWAKRANALTRLFTLSLTLSFLVQFKLSLVQFDIVRTWSKGERYRNGAHQTPWVIFRTVDGTIVMNNKINSCALECLRKPTTEHTIFVISCTQENVRSQVLVRQRQ